MGISASLAHRTVHSNGIDLHVVQAGPQEGPLVVLLHGFPEFWYGWRHQIPALAEAGYWVWAPDQRGYNLSDKPQGVAAYNLDELAKDVVGLIDAAGREKTLLVGHDWGAAVAWWTAITYPQRVEKLAILNVPHPAVLRRTIAGNPRQMLKSWYIAFFQIPWLPEALLRFNNWQAGVRAIQGSARPGTFSAEEIARYRQAWRQPGAFTAMLNWYRAIVRYPPRSAPSIRVTVPTLMIWGVHDVALDRAMAQPSIEHCDRGRLVFLEEATHWVQHDEPAQVNQLLLNFF